MPGDDPARPPPPATARSVVLVVDGPIEPADVVPLCERVRAALARGDADVVTCDVGSLLDVDLVTVDALARMLLTARRTGGSVQVRGASAELLRLLDLAGLTEIVPRTNESPFEMVRQAEAGEQGRVEEVVDVHDPAG
jgi:ABC-type transporter Mla MlaB component